MLPAIGIIGMILCMASVLLLGFDLAHYLNNDLVSGGHFHMTKILELLRMWTPAYWMRTVNYINTSPPREFWANMADCAVSMPATIVGLLMGVGLVVVGFRIRRYRY